MDQARGENVRQRVEVASGSKREKVPEEDDNLDISQIEMMVDEWVDEIGKVVVERDPTGE